MLYVPRQCRVGGEEGEGACLSVTHGGWSHERTVGEGQCTDKRGSLLHNMAIKMLCYLTQRVAH